MTLKITLITVLLFIILFLVLDSIYPINTKIDYSTTIKSKEGIVLSSFLSRDDKWRYYFKNDEISELLKKSIIFKEDKYFYYHIGINPISIIRAAYDNILSGKINSGASTITMQTARLLEPKKRTFKNKIIELFRALQIEFHYSKDEILEIYLNKIPFGSNIEGVGAASVLYFGKNPDKLSLAQAVALSVIPNNPNQLNIKLSGSSINQKKNLLIERLKESNLFDSDVINDARNENINPERLPTPSNARHFCRRAARENPSNNVLNTTINYTIQYRIESLLKNYISEWKNYGVQNAAALLIDNRTSEIVAYIGSDDFWADSAGQVDGVIAVRSPGSTLKPLLYALALDEGIITPKLALLDVPILDAEYSPGNFDGGYRGRVTAEFALAQSLNIPAVNLLNQYGYKKFADELIKMNFKSISANKQNLGLSLILGGCGVNLEQLCNLFKIFANHGEYNKAEYLPNQRSTSQRIISPESAYLISEILTKPQRPDFPNHYQSALGMPHIAWKTGTSQGRRDGWAIGYNGAYTLGIWTGNFSGKPNSYISGANIAVPLLFEIFHSLQSEDKKAWLNKPAGLDTRLVDATTGLLPSEFSTNMTTDYYIPGISASRSTAHLVQIWVSNDEKISYCSDCLPMEKVKQKVYEVYPVELQLYYKSQSISFVQIPPHNPKCNAQISGKAPVIISPVEGSEYFIEIGSGEGLSLKGGFDNDVFKTYWFINGKFFASIQKSSSTIWIPEESGNYKISCVDDKGRSSEVKVKIKVF